MAAFNKFNEFTQDLGAGEHTLNATDTLKIALTNTLPTAADLNWNVTDHPAPTNANGYTAGGNSLTGVTYTESAGVSTLTATGGLVFTATAGGIGPFQYVVLYNSSSASPVNAAIGWYDYASSISLADTETFTLTVTTNLLTVT